MKPEYDTDLAYIHHVGYSDYVRNAAPGLLAILRSKGIKSGLVVDLGCAGGLWARELTSHGYDALGIDISPAMFALARKNRAASPIHRGVVSEEQTSAVRRRDRRG